MNLQKEEENNLENKEDEGFDDSDSVSEGEPGEGAKVGILIKKSEHGDSDEPTLGNTRPKTSFPPTPPREIKEAKMKANLGEVTYPIPPTQSKSATKGEVSARASIEKEGLRATHHKPLVTN